ncbi:MAG: SUMF1/EgtB/PvdO family nonheme iron enzyme [Phycisphaeraceae bacterium]|nr:SUMF1/EgtB/PvdO family nonheme iron enzyme [Phycisphaeraceae bacterium]MCB9847959.1 SUMF1/EgtB/PvdO family nonheme iron enzyme [Phycisphaeraceae bacterium]
MKNTPYSISLAAIALATLTLASPAIAGGGVPDYDFDWAVIGDPGNAPYNGEYGEFVDLYRGGTVDHTYRLATKEVSEPQWYEFVLAYAPYAPREDWNRNAFNGNAAQFSHVGADGVPVFTPAFSGYSVEVSWEYAARYVNWLHNGKALTRDAFESGAYDTSTFGRDPDTGRPVGQATRSEGARFWIPSVDEWKKAAFYDPNRYGQGQGGWWPYPNAQDTPLIPGQPGEGQTNAGLPQDIFGDVIGGLPLPGSYPEVNLPWGLLDVSGSVQEWAEDYDPDGIGRHMVGTHWNTPDFVLPFVDHVSAAPNVNFPDFGFTGLRIASAYVPESPSLALPLLILTSAARRRVRN